MGSSNGAWDVVAAALGSSSLTIIGTFWLDKVRQQKDAIAKRTVELRTACSEIISGAFRVSQKASALHANMIARSGLRETFDVVLHHRQPPDVLEFSDYLFSELKSVLDAQSVIWLLGSRDLIAGASDVVGKIDDVISTSTQLQPEAPSDATGRFVDNFKVFVQGFGSIKADQGIEQARNESLRRLAIACLRFGETMRREIDQSDVDVLLAAFPKLRDGVEQSVEVGSSEEGPLNE